MLFNETRMCRHDRGELCVLCKRFINPGQFYVRADSQIAHYKCAKKKGWQKRRPKKKDKFVPEFAPPRIRVVKHVYEPQPISNDDDWEEDYD